jgi:hypothetical protein
VGGEGGGGRKIELRSATNVDLYNTKSLDTKLQHDCGIFTQVMVIIQIWDFFKMCQHFSILVKKKKRN